MRSMETLGKIPKYLIVLVILSLETMGLIRLIFQSGENEYYLAMLIENILDIALTVGLGACLLLFDMFERKNKYTPHNFLLDLKNEESSSLSIRYNGIISSCILSFFGAIFTVLFTITKIKVFLIISGLFTIVLCLIIVLKIIATSLELNQSIKYKDKSISTIQLALVPSISLLLLKFVTNKHFAQLVFDIISNPKDKAPIIMMLLGLLLYSTGIIYSYFTILYLTVAFGFDEKKTETAENKIEVLKLIREKNNAKLQEITQIVDAVGENCNPIKKINLALVFLGWHIIHYLKEFLCDIKYLLLRFDVFLIHRLSDLLEPKKAERLRFVAFESIIIIELLVLDFLLFIYMGSDDQCSRFFELLSTVIIIPIFISSISEREAK